MESNDGWSRLAVGERLDGHVESLRKVRSRIECVLACIASDTCSSVNFNHTSLNGKFSCELNSKNEEDVAGALTYATGIEYWDKN